ncbi:MAG: chemotaxis protein CheW [Cyanobacteria bacterium P01_F01_bin.4]
MQHHCWQQIGLWGDRTCPELETVIHCHSCPVYAQAGRNLLERAAPKDYAQDWADQLAQPPEDIHNAELALMIFRLGVEWFALPATLFQQIIPPVPIHTLPHRSNEILQGIVNVNGSIRLCVALHPLLNVGNGPTVEMPTQATASAARQMAVIAQGQDIWVFSVDQLIGIQRFSLGQMQPSPAAASCSPHAHTQGIFSWQDTLVNYLNEQTLFKTLNERIL